ncbi:MAG: Unknown protein [uncultured Sulfurovum sp.]|uniref:Uncharacterized protein n=1 Tax=uncultured Sulfurovum sp. TaxID=269237 RepID=A0A6S6TZU4_9BACT|nr:MAG: Unknown protein [uncultured Sulfurovum sp.]
MKKIYILLISIISFITPLLQAASCESLVTSVMPSGLRTDATNINRASVLSFDYDHKGEMGDFPTPTTLATANEVGTVWGKAYNANNNKLYTAAFLRRHADLSPDGLGAIYEIDVNTQTPTLWMDLNTLSHLGASATLFPYETAANRGLGTPFTPSHDVWAYSRVAKEGIGGLDLSDDYSTMYAMDMTNRQVLEIDVASKTVTNRYAVNDPGCIGGAGNVRPFGVDYINGDIYIGVTCSAETTIDYHDVDAYVMKLNASTFIPVVTNAKGFTWAGYWSDDPYAYGSSCSNFTYALKNAYVPLITNMEIDNNGHMLIGLTSRTGWQFAEGNYVADTSCSNLVTGHASRGFILNATPSGSTWVLNADETWNTDNGDEQHHYKDAIYAHWGSGTSQTFVGGMAKTSCSGQEVVLANLMDPLNHESGGTRFIRTSDAQHETATAMGDTSFATSKSSTTELYHGVGSTWEKSSGMGDIEYLSLPSSNPCDGRSYGINYDSLNNHSAIHEITSIGTTTNSMTTTLLKNDAFPFKSISLTKSLDNKLYAVQSASTLSLGETTPIYSYDPSTPSIQATDTGILLPYPNKNLWWISGGTDPSGNLYFILKDGSYLVKVDLNTSVVTTVWSTWPSTTVQAPGGENFGELSINLPIANTLYYDITFDSTGDALISDADGHYVWKVSNINSSPSVAYQGTLNGMTSISDPQWIQNSSITRLYGSDANTPDGTYYIDTSTWNTTKVGTESFYDMASCDFNMLSPPVSPPVTPMQPFSCNETLYLSNRNLLGTGAEDSGKTWLHSIDRGSNPYTYTAIGSEYLSVADGYNALGYNIQDNFMYALDGNHLLKIDSNATVQDLGVIAGLPAQQLYAGEFDRDGYLYVSGNGSANTELYKIDINSSTVINTINMSSAVRFWDMAIDETGDYFYVMLINNAVYQNDHIAKIHKDTGVISNIGSNKGSMSSYISLVFTDIEGKLFMMSNENGFYNVDTNTGEMYNISNTQDLTIYNDGTSCPDANITLPLMIGVDTNVIKYEGDTGLTDFVFRINFNKPAPINSGFSYTISDGTATLADNDYLNQSVNIVLMAGTTEANITVKVQTDTKMEENENFYLTLYNPLNLTILNAVGMGTILNDDVVSFNVERTNSNTTDNMTQDRKEALYTQISGRDFNYAVVTYDKNTSNNLEEAIEDITVKVELLDINNSDKVLYEEYLYFTDAVPSSRLDRTLVNDLLIPSAHRDMRYHISYILDINGSIVKGQYDNAMDYQNMKSLYFENTNTSRDNFAIRPEKFNIQILDGLMLRKNSNDGDNTAIQLAAGYDYDLNITAMNMTTNIQALDYNTSTTRILTFRSSGNCHDESNNSSNEIFQDGQNNMSLFEHQNVGLYHLSLQDTEWTRVDSNKTISDCILDSNNTSANSNALSGCYLVSNSAINTHFYPYQFDINFTMNNLPDSGHDDFLYMYTLSNTNNNYAIQFEGNITAQSEDNITTTNFTNSCVAENVNLTLDANSLSEDGNNTLLLTSPSPIRTRTDVKLSRLINFNSDSNSSLLEVNNNLDYIRNNTLITADKFLDANHGRLYLDMRYNINKNLSETINPIQISFENIEVNSSDSNSIANDRINVTSNIHTPKGIQSLNSSLRDFYFTQVSSDKVMYPKINFNNTQIVRTPLNVDIFCDKNMSYCQKTNIFKHTDTSSLNRSNQGWYLSLDHNLSTDGKIQNLNPNSVTVTVNPSSNIDLTKGRNGLVINTFNNCNNSNDVIMVEIVPDTVLLYNSDISKAGRPEYSLSCTNTQSSLSGIGETSHILNNTANDKQVQKMTW